MLEKALKGPREISIKVEWRNSRKGAREISLKVEWRNAIKRCLRNIYKGRVEKLKERS